MTPLEQRMIPQDQPMTKPWFKAAGGKRALAPTILPLLGLENATRYVEPFLGGGAVFLAVRGAGFAGPCLLDDKNAILMDAWRAVQAYPNGVIEAFKWYAGQDSREFYYEVRQDPPSQLIQSAGWFLYLNKHCFNGLYRVNSRGTFNVPYGNGRVESLDEDAVWAASGALGSTGSATNTTSTSLT